MANQNAEQIEAVDKIDRVEGSSKADSAFEVEQAERVPPNKEQFDNLMVAQSKTTPAVELPEMSPQRAKLLQEIQEVNGRVDMLKGRTPEDLMRQSKDAIAQIDEIKSKLKTPGLQFKDGSQVVLQNKLEHIDDKLRLAIEKVGGEYSPAEIQEPRSSIRTPIERFFGGLENSEGQLHHIYQQIATMGADAKQMSPATLLSLQMKVGYVQQELELFTSILNKSLESIKTLMNVQV